MSLAGKIILAAEAYLKGEETAEFKHEYQNGKVWPMIIATYNHVTIAFNLASLLKQYLKESLFRTYI